MMLAAAVQMPVFGRSCRCGFGRLLPGSGVRAGFQVAIHHESENCSILVPSRRGLADVLPITPVPTIRASDCREDAVASRKWIGVVHAPRGMARRRHSFDIVRSFMGLLEAHCDGVVLVSTLH